MNLVQCYVDNRNRSSKVLFFDLVESVIIQRFTVVNIKKIFYKIKFSVKFTYVKHTECIPLEFKMKRARAENLYITIYASD